MRRGEGWQGEARCEGQDEVRGGKARRGAVAALRVCKRCAAPGPMARGAPSMPQNSLKNNGYTTKKSDLWSYSKVLSKCRKCHFRDLKFKNVFGGESPSTPYICHHFVGAQMFSRTEAHTHVVPPLARAKMK